MAAKTGELERVIIDLESIAVLPDIPEEQLQQSAMASAVKARL